MLEDVRANMCDGCPDMTVHDGSSPGRVGSRSRARSVSLSTQFPRKRRLRDSRLSNEERRPITSFGRSLRDPDVERPRLREVGSGRSPSASLGFGRIRWDPSRIATAVGLAWFRPKYAGTRRVLRLPSPRLVSAEIRWDPSRIATAVGLAWFGLNTPTFSFWSPLTFSLCEVQRGSLWLALEAQPGLSRSSTDLSTASL